MRTGIDINRWLLALDLTITTIWAIFTLWCIGGMEMYAVAFIAPVIAMRIAVSFSLYRKEWNALWIVGFLLISLIAFCICEDRHSIDGLLMPFAKFVEVVWRFFTENTSLTEGPYQYLTHVWEESMQKPRLSSWVAIWALSVWVYAAPVVWSIVLECKKQFVKVSWPWKKIIGYGVRYVILVLAIAFAGTFLSQGYGSPSIYGVPLSCVWLLGSIAITLPFTGRNGIRLGKAEMEYIVAMACVGLAILAGFTTPK